MRVSVYYRVYSEVIELPDDLTDNEIENEMLERQFIFLDYDTLYPQMICIENHDGETIREIDL